MMQQPGHTSWRRDPIGAGLRFINQRRTRTQAASTIDVAGVSLDEYEDGLRAAHASEHMIAKEVKEFKALKAEYMASRKELSSKREQRRKRAVDRGLSKYVDAEIRRSAGVVADEIIEDYY